MPPGVPVACVAIDGAKNAGLLAARIINRRDRAATRATRSAPSGATSAGCAAGSRSSSPRPTPGRRQGKVPAGGRRRLPRARLVHGRGGQGARARRPTTTSPRSSTWSPARSASEGRWIHYGLTSSDVLDTALAPAAGRGRADHRQRRDRLPRRAGRQGPRARRDAVRRAHPRRPRRADDLRAAARRLRVRGRPQPRAACATRSSRPRSASSPARSAPTPRPRPRSRRR